MEQNRTLSAQFVPFLVLLVAIIGVGLYVSDLDIRTDVKSAEQSLLPRQVTDRTTLLTVNYPKDWVVRQDSGGLILVPDNLEDDESIPRIEFTTSSLSFSEVFNLAERELEAFPASDGRAGRAYRIEQAEPVEPGRPERIDYVIFIENPDGRTIQGTLYTNENDLDDYQEIFEAMARTAMAEEVSAPELAQEYTDEGLGISFNYPEDWTVQPGEGEIVLVPVNSQTAAISFTRQTLETIAGEIFGLAELPEDLTAQALLETLAEQLTQDPRLQIETVETSTFGDLEGATLPVINTQAQAMIDVTILDVPDSDNDLLVIAQTTPAEATLNNLILDSVLETMTFTDAAAPAEDDTPADDATDDSEADTTEDDTTDAEADTDTGDAVDDTADADSDAADDATDDSEADTTEDDTTATETDTDAGDAVDDTADADSDATGDEVVEVNFVDTYTNEERGFSIGVPAGFNVVERSASLYMEQSSTALRFNVVEADDILNFATETFGLELEALPEGDLHTALLEAYRESIADMNVSEVQTEDNRAYLDATILGRDRRIALVTLPDGRLLYADAQASAENISQAAATLLATLDTVEVMETASLDEDTADAADDSEADTTTNDSTDAADADTADTDDSADTDTEADAGDDTADADTTDPVADDTSEAAVEIVDDEADLAEVEFVDTFESEDPNFVVSIPEGYEVRNRGNFIYIERGSTAMRLTVIDDLAAFVETNLGFELAEIPNTDVAVNLLSNFATTVADQYDFVTGVSVTESGNRAYVDLTRFGRERRVAFKVFEDGQIVFADVQASEENFDEAAELLLAVLNSLSFQD